LAYLDSFDLNVQSVSDKKSHEDAMPFNEKIINERHGDIAALVEIMRA